MESITKQRIFTKSDLTDMEKLLRSHPEVHLGDSDACPLKHHFTDGIYTREIFIPAGTAVVGAVHKHEHPNFLLSGTVRMATLEGFEEITGPVMMFSKPGIKRALFAVTDLVWVTVHANPSNIKDTNILRKKLVVDSYEEYDKLVSSPKNKIISFFKSLIRRIS